MSVFAFTNLILSKNEQTAELYLDSNENLEQLNSKWVCFQTDNDKSIDVTNGKGFAQTVKELSERIPVLYFTYAEDHGLGYVILHDRKPVSTFHFDWGYYEEISMIIAEEMYGEEEGFDLWIKDRKRFDNLAIRRQKEYLEEVFFHNNANPENFKLFEFSENDICKLRSIFVPEEVPNSYGYPFARTVMAALDIESL